MTKTTTDTARVIAAELGRQAESDSMAGYVDAKNLTETTIDGYFDLTKVAAALEEAGIGDVRKAMATALEAAAADFLETGLLIGVEPRIAKAVTGIIRSYAKTYRA